MLLSIGEVRAVAAYARYLVRLGKALMTDKRIPRFVRVIFAVALVVKCSPIDFGIDEALLAIGAGILAVFYRDEYRAVRDEVRG